MSSKAEEADEATQLALEYMKKKKVSVREAAKKYKIGRERLRGRLKGVKSRHEKVSINRKLNQEMEKALLQYCKYLDDIGVSARVRMIERSAKQILARAHRGPGPAPKIGKNWSARFIKRHPELVRVKQKPLDIKRLSSTILLLSPATLTD